MLISAVLLVIFSLVGCNDETNEISETISSLEDGQYVGYSNATKRGYLEANITIEEDEIVDVELIEYQAESNQVKDKNYSYDNFHNAIDELPDRFIETNDSEVKVVSGATSTSNQAMEAVDMALQKAKGIRKFNGTYMGLSNLDNRGNHAVAWVTIEDEEIIEVKLEEADNGEYKDDDYSLEEYHEAKEELSLKITEVNSTDIDIYSGATSSSEKFIEATNNALEKAGLNL